MRIFFSLVIMLSAFTVVMAHEKHDHAFFRSCPIHDHLAIGITIFFARDLTCYQFLAHVGCGSPAHRIHREILTRNETKEPYPTGWVGDRFLYIFNHSTTPYMVM